MMLVSMATKKDLCSIAVLEEQRVIEEFTFRYKDWEQEQNPYKRLFFIVKKALRIVKRRIESNRSDDVVAFEVSNSIFVKWVKQEYANDTYYDDFAEVLIELNQIPMIYTFQYSKEPVANYLLSSDNIATKELSDIDSILEGVEE